MNIQKQKSRKWINQIIDEIFFTIEYCQQEKYFYALNHLNQIIVSLLKNNMENLSDVISDSQYYAKIAQLLQSISEAEGQENYIYLSDLLEELLDLFVTMQKNNLQEEQIYIDEEQLKNNILLFDKRFPGLLKQILEYDLCSEYNSQGWLSDNGFNYMLSVVNNILNNGYSVEFADSGEFTLALNEENNKKYYLHTARIISRESYALANQWLTYENEKYVCYGLGFGYPYRKMLELDENITVTVVEGNVEVLILALVFCDMADLLGNPRFILDIDMTDRKFMDYVYQLKSEGCYIYQPSLKTVKSENYRKQLEEYFISDSSMRTLYHTLNSNFKHNQHEDFCNIWDIHNKFDNKDIYIIAAGPSLDKNIDKLQYVVGKEDSIILSTGTVLRKLLNHNIKPDYVIVTDPNIGVYHQIEGIEDCGVPMIFLSSANGQAVSSYKSDKYIMYQRGYHLSESQAEREEIMCVDTGGSVSTTALDLAIKMNSKRIIFVGLDLAYTNGFNHAGDTNEVQKVSEQDRYMVASVDGGNIQSARNLLIYLHWIEDRLARMRREGDMRPVIDATEGGALVKGTEIMTLEGVIG